MSTKSSNITAAKIAASFKDELLQATSEIKQAIGRPPKLVGILANADEPSRLYAESTRKACTDLGLDFDLKLVGSPEDRAQPSDVEQAVLEANMADDIDGIMVYFPIFGPSEDGYIQQVVSPAKDVEGLHFFFRFNLYHNIRYIQPSSLLSGESPSLTLAEEGSSSGPKAGLVKAILPCTPLAIVKALENLGVYNNILEYGRRAFGKTITVINRSEVVGRPLAALLANDGARVFSADENGIVEYTRRKTATDGSTPPAWAPHYVTENCSMQLKDCLAISDVVISGVPSPKFKVKTSELKDGLIAVNFSSAKNFEADIKDKASIYLASIGKITISMLQRNLLRRVKYRKSI